MKVVVTEQARAALLSARDYYNSEMSGLGYGVAGVGGFVCNWVV